MTELSVHTELFKRGATDPLAGWLLPMRRWRQAVARSVQDRCDASEFDKPEIGRDAFPPCNHTGQVVGASAWLAFYVIAVTIAFGQ